MHIRLSLQKQIQQHRIDILIILVLAIAIAFASYFSAQKIPTPVINDFYAQDVWFGSDIPTVFGNITSLQSDNGRNNKHPLFPLIVFPIVYGFGKLFNLEPILAVSLVTALVASVWISSLFILFRLIGCPRLDATLFSALGGVSAASIFWFVVPESFSFGSLTIVLGLLFTALTQHRKFSPIWYVAIGVVTVSITITNWMVGLLATFVNQRWKKSLQIIVITLGVSTAFWTIQRIIFPNSGFPFQLRTFIGEKKFISTPESDGVLAAFSSFVYKTIVMPAIQLSDSSLRLEWPKLIANPLALGSGGFWGMLAIALWTGLLGLGLWGFFTTKKHPKLRIVLGLTLLAQIFLHSIYGTQETFIYSLHFAPLLVILATFSTLTRLRWLALAFAGLLVISAGINNQSQFNQLTAALQTYGTPQQQVQAQMQARPSDPWTRSEGHVILANPGSRAEDKSYYEPGGSFSPLAGSFGVAIWVVDEAGKLKATSDSIPLNQIQQQFVYTAGKDIPGISAKTEYYQASWTSAKPGSWQLNLKAPTNSAVKPVLVIRSVGPAGAAVKSLRWDGQQLRINDRWSVKPSTSFTNVYLGNELVSNWMTDKPTLTQWEDPKGWGYARLELPGSNTWEIEITDSMLPPKPSLVLPKVAATLDLNLPDQQFVDSINAQSAHLMMGLVGNRTHPSDPLSYPLPRFQDGAYQMVAIARAGHLEVAKQLSTYFAETDFFNSTGLKADIPALGIWALAEVATRLNQTDYDQWLWPHVRRKVELILELLATNQPGYPFTEKSKKPFSEYPDFLTVDQSAGKMETAQGLISLDFAANIMSYRALMDAAALADRVKQPADAENWRNQAAQLQAAWQKAFETRFVYVDATYTSGLWPSWIAATDQEPLKQELKQRWSEARDEKGAYRQTPVDTYFDIAEAHQWLFLGDRDRVWTTLQWFWNHQASPGLYTWWGGNEEPDGTLLPKSFSRWQRFRGWINPSHVTPHYWTAAEMLLLQLDMLAYVNQAKSSPTVVIGAGIPQTWLNQPMSVKGLSIGGNLLNWIWDGKQITVQMRGTKMDVQLGAVFPSDTPVNVVMLQASASEKQAPVVPN